jgi:molecular chaperone HtpG
MNEQFTFKAEVNQLLNLIINTFYSNKDIFLRELISNSSDALDKFKHFNLQNDLKIDNQHKYEINIDIDVENKILRIFDSGIGMTKDEVIQNIGTIAKSGTKELIDDINSLIGQFGVGFYSAFLVSERVKLITKSYQDSNTYKWESDAKNAYTISTLEEKYTFGDYTLTQGTVIECHLKDDCEYLLDKDKLKEIIKTHSQFIGYPIILDKTPLNTEKPVWTKNQTDISQNEASELYKRLTNSQNTPLCFKQISGQGIVDYTGMLFLPERVSEIQKNTNIKLYVRKVFVTDKNDLFCPEWLNFITGIIDTDDLPLNVSREMLQETKVTSILKKAILNKSIDMLKSMMNENEKYNKIYDTYHKNFKIGVFEEENCRERIADLLMFNSFKYPETKITFDKYIENNPNQDTIYFMTGENVSNCMISPFMKRFKKKNIDVLIMTDPVDEYVMTRLISYKSKKFECITKGDVILDENEKVSVENLQSEHKTFCDEVKKMYPNDFIDVKITNKIDETYPCIITSSVFGLSANMENILKFQTMSDDKTAVFMNKRILEINVENKIMKTIMKDVQKQKHLLNIVVNTALIYSGFNVLNSTDFTNQLLNIVKVNLDIDQESDNDITIVSSSDSDMNQND